MIIPVGGTARVGSCKQTSRASGGPGLSEVADVVGYVVMVTPLMHHTAHSTVIEQASHAKGDILHITEFSRLHLTIS